MYTRDAYSLFNLHLRRTTAKHPESTFQVLCHIVRLTGPVQYRCIYACIKMVLEWSSYNVLT